ncbi:MAG: hypothetical protein QJR01_05080 [Kyrpidia sp.]|nr:hypothetical protein [Kyrpidia sp.]
MNIAAEWKSWNSFYKTLLLASTGFVVTGAILGYGAIQSRGAAREATARAENASAQVQSLERQVAKPVPPPDLSTVGRAIPNEWEMARFFADLAVAARTRGVSVVSVTPTKPPEDHGAYSPSGSRPGSGGSAPKTGRAVPAGGGTGPAPGTAAPNNGNNGNGGSTGNGQPKPGASGGQTPASAPGAPSGQSPSSGPGGAAGSGSNPGNEAAKSGDSAPPPSIPGLYTLDLSLEAEGSGANLLGFIDELQAMPRFVWIDEYTLDFSQQNQGAGGTPVPAKLSVKFTLYSHAPWDAKAANETPWPFPIEPAGNPEAFGGR